MPLTPETMALAKTIASARARYIRRHCDNELAFWLNLVPRLFHAYSLADAEDRLRAFIRSHRKRFWWCVESDALTVLRQTVWAGRRAENQF